MPRAHRPGPESLAPYPRSATDAPRIPGVTIDGMLGRGAFTVVYSALRGDERYAIKVLQVAGPDVELAFRREAAVLACLDDPGLVRIHEIGTADGRPYLIMDLVRGSSLEQVLADEAVPEQRLVACISRVAGALTVAHRAGMVHRDVKPANIMIGVGGEVKLIDFGLAGRSGTDPGAAAVGTFAYSAPEQTGMLRRVVDGRADLYALGVVLFQGLTGRLPFSSPDVGELLRLHLAQPAPDVREVRPEVPAILAAIVAKLLAKDPDDRYRSGDGLRADLARVASGERDVYSLGTADAGATTDVPLVDRHPELTSLRDRWTEAMAGHGGLVVVEGPAGSGKSRLVRELIDQAATAGRQVWDGRCFPDHAVPFAPLRQAVEHHLRTVRSLPPASRAAALERLHAAAGDARAVLAGVSPALAAALDASSAAVAAGPDAPMAADSPAAAATRPAPGPSVPRSDDQHQFARLFASFIAALAAAEGGVTLYVDDLQWCDDATQRVLRALAPLLDDTPLLVVATVRDEHDHADDTGRPGARSLVDGVAVDQRITLPPLELADVASLIRSEFGPGTVPEDFVSQLHVRSGGSPLAVRSYARAVVDAGLIRPSWGAWVVDDEALADLPLASDVTDLFLTRLRRLDAGTLRLLTVAAAVGVRFDAVVVGQVSETPEEDVLTALSSAAFEHVVEPQPGGGYGFLHDRIRDTLLAEVDDGERRRLHQAIAEYLERSGGGDDAAHVYAVADHYLRGETYRDPRPAVRAATAAGVRALAEHSAADACRFLSRAEALAEAGQITLDGEFHVGAGTAAAQLGQFDASDHHFGLALAAERDPLRRARIRIQVVDTYQQRWEGDRALAAVREGLSELGHPLPGHPIGMAVTSLAAFLRGVTIGRLPRRVREVTGRRRQHHELWAELLNAGTQAAGAANRLPQMLALNLRTLPVANRLDAGWAYMRSKVNLAILARVAGMRSACTRLLDRAAAATDPTDPAAVAFVAWARSLADDFVAPMDGRSGEVTRACLDRHGRWLAAGDLLTSTGMLGVFQIARGYPAEAQWLDRFTRERIDDADQICGATLGIVGPLAAALRGDPATAVAGLDRIRQFLRTIPENRSQNVNVAFAATVLAVEQGETGRVLDDALAEYAALGVTPGRSWPFQRLFWVYQALGRLSQLAAADAAGRPGRLDDAARAVTELKRAVNGPFLNAFHRVCEASLQQLRGDHDGALRTLAQAAERSLALDAPLLQFEAARVAARALRGLDRQADARRQADIALLLATDGGWRARRQWVRTELELDPASFAAVRSSDLGAGDGAYTESGRRSSRDSTRSSRLSATTSGSDGGHRHDRGMRALHEVNLAAATILDPLQLARVTLDEIVRIFAAERAFLFVVQEQTGQLVPQLGRDGTEADIEVPTGYGASLVDRVHETGEPLVVTGSEHGAALGSQSAVVYDLRSIMVAPLLLKGRTVGVVYLDSRAAKGIFTPEDVDLLTAITANVALSLETARAAQLEVSVQAARRERDTAEFLRGAMRELTASLDPVDVAHRLMQAVARALPDTTAYLLHLTEDGELMLACPPSAGAAGHSDQADGWAPVAAEQREMLAGLLAATSPVSGRIDRDRLPLPGTMPPDTAAWLAMPLAVRGVERGLLIAATTGREYVAAEMGVAAALAGQGAVALDNALLFRKVEETAMRDGLTGLFNRRHFFILGEQRMAIWRRDGRPTAVAMIDIDHFKAVNDTHGHGVGDEVIRALAGRLHEGLRESDVIGRYGGEEFAMLLPETAGHDTASAVHRLHAELTREPVATAAGPLPVTVSIGVAFPEKPSDDLSDVLRAADEALYQAKREGRNRTVFKSAARG